MAAPTRTAAGVSAMERRQRVTGLAFLAPAVLYVLAFFLYPLIHNARMSLQDYTVASFWSGEAPFVGLDNYRAIVADENFLPTLTNTAVFTVTSIAFQFVIGLALAMFFASRFPLSSLIRSLMLLPWLLPLVVSASVWRWMFDQDNGVVNAFLRMTGLIDSTIPWLTSGSWAMPAAIITNIWIGIPFNLVLLYGGLQAIPTSLYEAAELDGAGAWRRFRSVTWPLLRPVTLVTVMLGLVYTLKVFDVIAVLTGGGPARATQTLTIWSYNLSFREFAFGQGAAVGNLLVVLAVVFGLLYVHNARKEVAS